ncbi:MAG TPA: hypothetical protein VIT45_13585 [Allosphingosinicella sp.]
MINTTLPAPPPPEWVAAFCKDYTLFLFDWGRGILIVAVLLGAALAIAAVIVELRKKPAESGGNAELRAPPAPTAILDSLKAFIQALSSLPTWLALFGGGVLLLWMAGNVIPEICKPPAEECPAGQKCVPEKPDRQAGGNSSAANTSADN